MNTPRLTCMECGGALAAADFGATVACPACGRAQTVFFFPALTRRIEAASSGSAAASGEALCFHHPGKQAEAVCEACGRFLCGLCRIEFNARTLCPACLARTQTEEAERHIPRCLRYDKLAMLSVLLSPFVYCISFFNACFTLYVCFRHWRTPISVLPRSRWRLHAAGLLALVVLAAWVTLGALTVSNISKARQKAAARQAEQAPQPRSSHDR